MHPSIFRAQHRELVPKTWGHEIWIANSPLYCGKLLWIKPGQSSSQHFHIKKTEDIYIAEGEMLLTLWDNAIESVHTLWPGDSIKITPGLVHKLACPDHCEQGVTLYEFSTQHFDSDSYRISR
tara:strand:- start:306 stop:674 length:369 start_codon:yes stop_codon:yes gene_type:complete